MGSFFCTFFLLCSAFVFSVDAVIENNNKAQAPPINSNKNDLEIIKNNAQELKKNKKWNELFDEYLKISNNYCKNLNFEWAKKYLNLAFQIKSVNLPKSPLNDRLFFKQKAYLYYTNGQYDTAAYYYQKVLENKWNIDSKDEIGNDLLNLAMAKQGLGDLEISKSLILHAIIQFKQNQSTSHVNLARAYNTLGGLYWRQSEFDSALIAYIQTLKYTQKEYSGWDTEMADVKLNIGALFLEKGNLHQALNYFEEVRAIYLANFHPLHQRLGLVYVNMGNSYGAIGDYGLALHYYQQALEISKLHNGENNPTTADIYNNLGVAYTNINQFDKAETLFKNALSVLTENYSSNYLDLSYSYSGLVSLMFLKEEFELASYYNQKIIDLFDGKNFLDNISHLHPQFAMAKLNAGEINFLEKELDNALINTRQAQELIYKIYGEESHFLAMALNQLGKIYYESNQVDSAQFYFTKALLKLKIDFTAVHTINHKHTNITLMVSVLYEVLFNIGKVHLTQFESSGRQQDLQKAFNVSRQALRWIDNLRNNYESDNSKLELIRNVNAIYEQALLITHKLYQLTYDQKYLEFAYNTMEKNKAFLLLNAHRSLLHKKYLKVPDSLYKSEMEIKSRKSYAMQQFYKAHQNSDSHEILRVQNVLFETENDYQQLKQQIRVNYPKYYQLKYQQKPNSMAEVQGKLAFREVVLNYFIGQDKIYILQLTKSSVRLHEIEKRPRIQKNMESFYEMLKKPKSIMNYSAQLVQDYARVAHEFYANFVQPGLIGLPFTPKKLLIIPDGLLFLIPFEASIFKLPKTGESFTQLAYLMNEFTISYANSCSLYVTQQQSNASEQLQALSVLGFAPDCVTNAKNVYTGDKLRVLPWSKRELSGIQSMFPTSKYIGLDATEQAFKNEAKKHRILHFATHARGDERQFRHAYLNLRTSKNNNEDGILYAYELYHMDLKPDLVVLSTCESGLGENIKGEGVMSLARAFLYAGSKCVVQTLWNTSDKAAAELMILFYDELKKGRPKDIALNQAKIAYLKKNKHPFYDHPSYWANFVLIGNTNPISSSSLLSSIWILLIIWSIGLGAIFVVIFQLNYTNPIGVFDLIKGRNLKIRVSKRSYNAS